MRTIPRGEREACFGYIVLEGSSFVMKKNSTSHYHFEQYVAVVQEAWADCTMDGGCCGASA